MTYIHLLCVDHENLMCLHLLCDIVLKCIYLFCCYFTVIIGEHDLGRLRLSTQVTYFPPLDVLRSTLMVAGEQSVALDLEQKRQRWHVIS